jgi:hypothetical protein
MVNEWSISSGLGWDPQSNQSTMKTDLPNKAVKLVNLNAGQFNYCGAKVIIAFGQVFVSCLYS